MKRIADILYKRPFLLFVLFVVVAYLPVFLPFFHLKNDLITQNLPTRYIISESLYSGYFPWWNPYIHFGIPQYGDMNNGFWNPFMWLLAKTAGYNIWTISFEEMFYILVGGCGMYKLVKELGIFKGIAIIISLSYMSCGYITGHLQHFCWITGTAFFPFVALYFLKINKVPILKNYILGALSVFLFASSTHPGLIIGACYFFIFAVIIIFIFRKTHSRSLYHPKFWVINFTFLLLSGVFSIAVIMSNVDVLQHISRGTRVNLDQSLLQPTSLQSYISLLFPLAVNKTHFFATDISMRNVYMGLAALGGFIFVFNFISKKIAIAVLIPLLFFILLSSGGVFKTIFYHTIPFAGYVRLNGEFTYFSILIILLLSAFGLQYWISDENYKKKLKRLSTFLSISILLAFVIAVTIIITRQSSIIYETIARDNFKTIIKSIIDHLHFADLLIIIAIIQLLTLWFIRMNYSHEKALFIVALNLVIVTWLSLPFTGLGMSSKKEMNDKMTVLPRGLQVQELQPLNKTGFLDSSLKSELLLLGSYSKKIGYPVEEQYPVQLRTTERFFEDEAARNFITRQSFVFLSTDTTPDANTNFDSSVIQIREFGPGRLKLTVNNNGYNYITFLQNNYPYWETFVNGSYVMSLTGYKTFITIPIVNGKQEVEFRFNPSPIKKAAWLNLAIVIAGIILLFNPRFRNISLFS